MIEVLFFMGVVLFAGIAHKIQPSVIRFDEKSFLKGCVFLLFVTFLGWAIWTQVIARIFPVFFQEQVMTAVRAVADIHPMELMRVWWEDVIYAWPALILISKGYKKTGWTVLLLCLPHFVMGHLYQGPAGLMSAIFPFLAVHLGLRYGAITVCAWHIFYDLCVDLRVQIMLMGL